jgi:DNA-binding beta-propeller fold protein YncE
VATHRVRTTLSLKTADGQATSPFGLAIMPSGDRAWITLNAADEVVELDIAGGKSLRRFKTGDGPDGIGVAGGDN